ncbi:FDLD family class I lanthipeptide [Nocardia sp. NPDC052254]|uniref:FDLD family class I lanthipeptide n=1 Tax=Nocardia sp. NPDC052254 TaxID=3155681 RepID=UPI00342E8230
MPTNDFDLDVRVNATEISDPAMRMGPLSFGTSCYSCGGSCNSSGTIDCCC